MIRYAELQVATGFSFLEGASHADDLVERAVELGLDAIGVTDRNSFAGVVRGHIAAREVWATNPAFRYLVGVLDHPEAAGRTFDIGGT